MSLHLRNTWNPISCVRNKITPASTTEFDTIIASFVFCFRSLVRLPYRSPAWMVVEVDPRETDGQGVDEQVEEAQVGSDDGSHEEWIVSFADAQIEPHAVVIENVHAKTAVVAVLRRRLHFHLAVRAKILPALERPRLRSESRPDESGSNDEADACRKAKRVHYHVVFLIKDLYLAVCICEVPREQIVVQRHLDQIKP